MATDLQLATLQRYADAARRAGHIWPEYAACEAVLESNWGNSRLARDYHNLFGQKCPAAGPPPGVLRATMETEEFIHGRWIEVMATWLWFTSEDDSFRHRMQLLRSLSCYAPALLARSGEEFVTEVSRVWATDPLRAQKVLEIYRVHAGVLSVA